MPPRAGRRNIGVWSHHKRRGALLGRLDRYALASGNCTIAQRDCRALGATAFERVVAVGRVSQNALRPQCLYSYSATTLALRDGGLAVMGADSVQRCRRCLGRDAGARLPLVLPLRVLAGVCEPRSGSCPCGGRLCRRHLGMVCSMGKAHTCLVAAL